MPLTDQEKDGLRQQLATLLEHNEPEAILATLKLVARRKAHSVTRGLITTEEAERWQSLGQALDAGEAELTRRNAPKARPNSTAEGSVELPQDPSVSWNDEGLDGIDRRTPPKPAGKAQPIPAAELEQEHGRQGPDDPAPVSENSAT